MRRRSFLKQLLISGGAPVAVSLSGCGTLLHSERVHRPHSRDIDWKIVALNGLGLALFFVPGVLAFVVDFYTGAIYLPPQRHSGHSVPAIPEPPANYQSNAGQSSAVDDWYRETIPPQRLGRVEIERVVSRRVGSPISLAGSEVRVSPLATWDEYGEKVRYHLSDQGYGVPPEAFFQRLS